MKHYVVVWEIDIEANSEKEAAEKALLIQRNDKSIATVFEVYEHLKSRGVTIDLSEEAVK